jgi:hypothetical protein
VLLDGYVVIDRSIKCARGGGATPRFCRWCVTVVEMMKVTNSVIYIYIKDKIIDIEINYMPM